MCAGACSISWLASQAGGQVLMAGLQAGRRASVDGWLAARQAGNAAGAGLAVERRNGLWLLLRGGCQQAKGCLVGSILVLPAGSCMA